MAENNRKPRIRFKGFADAWEQRKLGEMGRTFTGLSGKTRDDFGHGEARFVTYMNVYLNPIADPKMTEAIEIDAKQTTVQYGDVFFTTSSETPDEVGMSCIWLENQPNTYLNSFCFGYRPTKPFDAYFLAYSLRSIVFREKMILLAQGISRYNISKNKVMDLPFSEAGRAEQSKVGCFLKTLDDLITLHQRKYDKLVDVKKSMLEKMFPQGDEKVPKIRFKGFSDAWEQRKFEDLYSYASEGGTPDTNNFAFYENGSIPFVKIEDTENKYIDSTKSFISDAGLKHSSAWVIPSNSVLFTNGATVGNVAINRIPVATKQGILGIIPTKSITTEFLFYLLSSDIFQHKVRLRMATGTFATIILKNLNQIPVCVPSNKDEQDEIANCLSALDNLITLHQRKLEKLKSIKSALLEKMFV